MGEDGITLELGDTPRGIQLASNGPDQVGENIRGVL